MMCVFTSDCIDYSFSNMFAVGPNARVSKGQWHSAHRLIRAYVVSKNRRLKIVTTYINSKYHKIKSIYIYIYNIKYADYFPMDVLRMMVVLKLRIVHCQPGLICVGHLPALSAQLVQV